MLTHLGTGDGGPLPRAVLDELHRPHIGIPISAPAGTVEHGGYVRSARMGYALGWRTDIHRGHPSIFHGGSNPGIRTFVRLVPSLGRGIAVFQNSDANHYLLARALCELAFDLLDGLPGQTVEAHLAALLAETALLTAARAPAVAPPPALIAPPTRPLAHYAGRYSVDGCLGGVVDLTDQGDHLGMQAGGLRYALHPHDGDRFHLSHVDPVFGRYGASGGEFRDVPTSVIFAGSGPQPDGFRLTDGVDSAEARRQAT
jgi:hypothetical protein